jgi:hypothetical protein
MLAVKASPEKRSSVQKLTNKKIGFGENFLTTY